MKSIIAPNIRQALQKQSLRMNTEVRRINKRRGNITSNQGRKKKVLPSAVKPDEDVGRQTGSIAEASSSGT